MSTIKATPTFTVLKVIGETNDEKIVKVRSNEDGLEGIATFNLSSGEGSFVGGRSTLPNHGVHDFKGVGNRKEFDSNYTAAPPPRDPLVIDLDGNGQFQLPIDWIQNQRGDKRYLSTSNPQGSGDGVLAYKDPTTGELHLFRDAIDGKGQSYHNAIEHLRALKDQQKNGVIEGKELEGVYLLRADGSAVPAEQVIKSIRLDYENVNEQGGLVRQKAKLAVELIDGRRFDMANVWPEANTLESVNTGIPPEALGNPELQARLANIPNIHSTGNTIPDLRFAAAKDPVLLQRIEALQRKIANRQEVTQAEWDGVVFRWTGVEAVTGSSFGMDNKRIQALRRLLSHEEGVAFGADGHGVQSQAAASSLNGQFDRYLERFKLLFAGRVRTQTEVAPVYNIEFNPADVSSLAAGNTITLAKKDQLSVRHEGQLETAGGTIINFKNGTIHGINIAGNDVYGKVRTDIENLREEQGAELSLIMVRETDYQNQLVMRYGKMDDPTSSISVTGSSTPWNWYASGLAEEEEEEEKKV